MKKKKRKIIIFAIFLCLLIFVIVGLINPLTTTNYSISNAKIASDLEGFTIVQISDFHCKSFGKEETKLIEQIKACDPDIIVFTGDMIDEDHTDLDNLEFLLKGISDLCPIYQVTGNHEKDNMVSYSKMCTLYKQYGVIDLNDSTDVISIGDSSIYLCGIDYFAFPDYWDTLTPPDNMYSILLYHNAEAFDDTSKLGYDLVLSGHTHGGLIRLPFVGGVLSTHMKLGAEYEKGAYEENGSTLISNTGLGSSQIPRFYNNREIVKITLKTN